jgi:hypothetical protein
VNVGAASPPAALPSSSCHAPSLLNSSTLAATNRKLDAANTAPRRRMLRLVPEARSGLLQANAWGYK